MSLVIGQSGCVGFDFTTPSSVTCSSLKPMFGFILVILRTPASSGLRARGIICAVYLLLCLANYKESVVNSAGRPYYTQMKITPEPTERFFYRNK